MQVYAWRQSGGDIGRHPKRPHAPWTKAEVDGVPATAAVARTIFERLVMPSGERDGAGSFRVGVASDLSPSIGIFHNGMAELSRLEVADRVYVTWLRGFWDALHVIYRTGSAIDAREVARDLVDRARAATRRIAPDSRLDIRLSGAGELRGAPHFVFVLVGGGSHARTGVDLVRAGQAAIVEPR